MNSNQNLTLNQVFRNHLSNPIPLRCQNLTTFLTELNLKELRLIYPYLVDDIFGVDPQGLGWNLLKITNQSSYGDVLAIKQFLSPEGPFFNITYKLLGDLTLKYEFAISDLPEKLKLSINEGHIPKFLSGKLYFPMPGVAPTCIILNSFEYYIFNFAKYATKPNPSMITCFDSVYSMLLQDYLNYLLPSDSDHIPPINYDKTGLLNLSNMNNTSLNTSFNTSSFNAFNQSKLLKPGLILSSPNSIQHSQVDIWRSETLLIVLCEFWLNQTELYNQDLIIMVRVLIKHIHYFCNSYESDLGATLYPCGAPPITINNLKGSVLSHVLQNKLYNFFTHIFDHWPLDSSFKLPLEAWLSYIQPWRYTNKRDANQNEISADHTWLKFISENLPFYTSILIQVMPRFFRMELRTFRTSQNLFRISKVFSQDNLIDLILEAETTMLPDPSYVSIHSNNFRSMINQLLTHLNQIKTTTSNVSNRSLNTSWIESLLSYVSVNDETDNEEKINTFLNNSMSNFSKAFELNPPTTIDQDNLNENREQDYEPVHHHLTEVGRYRIINGLASPVIEYRGHPELQPIRSYEIIFLVRILWTISNYLNLRYGNIFNERYQRQDWIGIICRWVLAAPTIYYEDNNPIDLPARINLRPLGQKWFILIAAIILMLAYFTNHIGLLIFFSAMLIASLVFILGMLQLTVEV